MSATKPFNLSKQQVMEAFKTVKANAGAAGVDEQSIEDFERDLKGNLYKVWNRMSSGSYFPPPVKAVAIPKKTGGERILGVPTVADRVAQRVVKMTFEPTVEPIFLPDSYGYRPRKSALDAVGITRERCWRYDWVLEFDIKGLFDHIDHEVLLRAVNKHTECQWVRLYIARWLKVPLQRADGTIVDRTQGTPQGGVCSPVLANLFMLLKHLTPGCSETIGECPGAATPMARRYRRETDGVKVPWPQLSVRGSSRRLGL
jgi:RNA-directed DNA polymerase